jgi:hypothetical protein
MSSKPPHDLASFRQHIADMLNQYRPDRAAADERGWRDPVYAWAEANMPADARTVAFVAAAEVDNAESRATTAGNKILRAFQQGQAPLSWDMVGPYPVVVGKLRIRLDAATPEDLEDAAQQLDTHARRNYAQELLLVDCLRDLARLTRRSGKRYASELGDLDAPDNPGGTLFGDGDDPDW